MLLGPCDLQCRLCESPQCDDHAAWWQLTGSPLQYIWVAVSPNSICTADRLPDVRCEDTLGALHESACGCVACGDQRPAAE